MPPSKGNFLVIGAGARGSAYARAVTVATSGSIVAVAEPDAFKRQEFGKKYIWSDREPQQGQELGSWKDWIVWETARRRNEFRAAGDQCHEDAHNNPVVTGVFICTLDETHAEIIHALSPLNLHILCEKPLALSLPDSLAISQALGPTAASPRTGPKIFSIGHVLRYSPHNTLLRRLLLHDKVIGEIVSIEHTEPIGWWHFSHSYVRGNWRRATPEGVGSLLTKSCHDIDFLLWLMCSPPDAAAAAAGGLHPHLPGMITSTGALTHFRKARKPKLAGPATNCLSCPAEQVCNYSAKKIYRDRRLRKEKDTGWPLKIVMPEIEDVVSSRGWDVAEDELMKRLAEDYGDESPSEPHIADRGWYGRCVYESDNNVVDDQTVTISWDDELEPGRGPKTAIFHMTYPTEAQCDRRGRVYGTEGEISYGSKTIRVYTFADQGVQTHVLPRQSDEEEKSHGGGDFGLARSFVQAVQKVEDEGMSVQEAQWRYVGCDFDEIIRSHAVVFAAEEARLERKVVDFREWWSRQVDAHSGGAPRLIEKHVEASDGRLRN